MPFRVGDRVRFENADSNGFISGELGIVTSLDHNILFVITDRGYRGGCFHTRWSLVAEEGTENLPMKFLLYKDNRVISPGSANINRDGDHWTRQQIDDFVAQYNRRWGGHMAVFHVIPLRSVATITATGVEEHE